MTLHQIRISLLDDATAFEATGPEGAVFAELLRYYAKQIEGVQWDRMREYAKEYADQLKKARGL